MWSKPKKASEEIPYDHVVWITPISKYIITWKSWKENPSYDVELDEIWLGSAYDLDEAKKIAENHLNELIDELDSFVELHLNDKA